MPARTELPAFDQLPNVLQSSLASSGWANASTASRCWGSTKLGFICSHQRAWLAIGFTNPAAEGTRLYPVLWLQDSSSLPGMQCYWVETGRSRGVQWCGCTMGTWSLPCTCSRQGEGNYSPARLLPLSPPQLSCPQPLISPDGSGASWLPSSGESSSRRQGSREQGGRG